MLERGSADRTAELLLRHVREPSHYLTEGGHGGAALPDSDVVLRLALGRRVEIADPALRRSSATVLRDAAASYIRHVFFRPGATPYQTLGVATDASPRKIKESFRLLMRLVHPDRQDPRAPWPESFAAQVNHAYAILRSDSSRAKFDDEQRAARARAAGAAAAAATPGPRVRTSSVGIVTRRPPPPRSLPEWLTAGVGGFVREHPAVVAFATLLGGAALVLAAALWEGDAGSLTREAGDARTLHRPAVRADVEPISLAPPGSETARLPEVVGSVDASGDAAATKPPVVARMNIEKRVVAESPPTDAPPLLPATTVAPATIAASAPTAAPTTIAAPAAPAMAPAPEAKAVVVPSPTTAEIEALFASFVDAYDHGRVDAFAALFDTDAITNLYRGQTAIRGEYDELFRQSEWRRMRLTRMNWRRDGERALAKGELAVRIGWRDGREVEQRVTVDIELARRGGRVVITRLSHLPSAQ